MLEEELRRDANKSLLPYFAEIRGDLSEVQQEIKSFREQFEKYAAEQKARAGQADTLLAMGNLLRTAGQFEAAMNFFQRAIAIFYELNAPVKVAISLEAIGITFELQGHFSEALEKYQEALRLAQQYGSPQYVAPIENNIVRVKGKMSFSFVPYGTDEVFIIPFSWRICNPKACPFNRPAFLARKSAAGPINGVTFNALVG